MSRRFSLALIALLILAIASKISCEEEKLTIVATIAPLGSIAREIGGDKVNVIVLVPGGSDPHQYAPKPLEAELIRTCDLFISIGKEPFLGQFPEKEEEKFLGWIDWIDGGIYVKNENPHYLWMYPDNVRLVSRVITNKLISLDPENREYYETNLALFEEKIASLKEWISNLKKMNDLEGENVVLGGAHFEPIAEVLGLNVLGIIIKGEERLPSPSELVELKKAAVQGKAKVIIVLATQKEGDEGRIADQISKETGIPIVYVYGVFVDERDSYIEFMKYTISHIISGIQAGRTAGGGQRSESTEPFWMAIMILAILAAFQTFLLKRCRKWSY